MLKLHIFGRANLLNEHGEIIFEMESGGTKPLIVPIHELHFVEGDYVGFINQRGQKCAVDVSMSTSHQLKEVVRNAV